MISRLNQTTDSSTEKKKKKKKKKKKSQSSCTSSQREELSYCSWISLVVPRVAIYNIIAHVFEICFNLAKKRSKTNHPWLIWSHNSCDPVYNRVSPLRSTLHTISALGSSIIRSSRYGPSVSCRRIFYLQETIRPMCISAFLGIIHRRWVFFFAYAKFGGYETDGAIQFSPLCTHSPAESQIIGGIQHKFHKHVHASIHIHPYIHDTYIHTYMIHASIHACMCTPSSPWMICPRVRTQNMSNLWSQ
jgi:hypothetical protein